MDLAPFSVPLNVELAPAWMSAAAPKPLIAIPPPLPPCVAASASLLPFASVVIAPEIPLRVPDPMLAIVLASLVIVALV
jgi:hypothetical protein